MRSRSWRQSFDQCYGTNSSRRKGSDKNAFSKCVSGVGRDRSTASAQAIEVVSVLVYPASLSRPAAAWNRLGR
jgi:hypothetical protein